MGKVVPLHEVDSLVMPLAEGASLRVTRFLESPRVAISVHGPGGGDAGGAHAVDDGRWQQAFLWSRVGAIAGGTSEVQANIIAQRILGLPR